MARKAWLIWRATPRGAAPSIQFDALPGPDGRAYGGRILATVELQPFTVCCVEDGSVRLEHLAQQFPPPAQEADQ